MADDTDETLRDGISRLAIADPLARIRPGYRPRDITQTFKRACQDLRTGQLVQQDGFTLWDAVQALEIGDPKMDSGYTDPEEDSKDEFDVSQDLLPSEIIWIMDEILCREMAWLRGFALFQTVFTSKHVLHLLMEYNRTKSWPRFTKEDKPHSIESSKYTHWCLHAFCMGTIIQCDMNAELVASQQYYEEEDLNTQTYNLNLCSKVGDDDCIKRLDYAMAWLQDRAAVSKTPDEDTAIWRRLNLRRILVTIFINGSDDVDFATLPGEIDLVGLSHSLGRRYEGAFDAKAYRKLAIGGPTREPATVPLEEALTDLRSLHSDFLEGSRLTELGKNPSAEALQAFLWRFASRSPPPSTLARAKLQAQLFSQGALFDVTNISRMTKELRELTLADANMLKFDALDRAPQSKSFQQAETVMQFMQEGFETTIDFYRALCQNKCRISRCLVNSVQNFQKVSDRMVTTGDSEGARYAQGIITGGYLQQVMASASMWAVQLGFEHELYDPYELSLMYRLVEFLRAQMFEFHGFVISSKKTAIANKYAMAKYAEQGSIAGIAAAFRRVYAVLDRLHVIKWPQHGSATSYEKMWEQRTRPFYSALPSDLESVKDFHTFSYLSLYERRPGPATLLEMLEKAEAGFDDVKFALQNLDEDDQASETLFELPSGHWLVKDWRDELKRRKRAIVQMRLEIHKLKAALPEQEQGVPRIETVREGYEVRVEIPTTAERTKRDKKGNLLGHPWWIVPRITVLEPPPPQSPLEELD